MIRIPDPEDPTKVIELSDDEFREHCANLYADDKKRPDGSNRSMRLHADDAIRLFQEGDGQPRSRTNTEPWLYPDEIAR